jgi:hypothetical protein
VRLAHDHAGHAVALLLGGRADLRGHVVAGRLGVLEAHAQLDGRRGDRLARRRPLQVPGEGLVLRADRREAGEVLPGEAGSLVVVGGLLDQDDVRRAAVGGRGASGRGRGLLPAVGALPGLGRGRALRPARAVLAASAVVAVEEDARREGAPEDDGDHRGPGGDDGGARPRGPRAGHGPRAVRRDEAGRGGVGEAQRRRLDRADDRPVGGVGGQRLDRPDLPQQLLRADPLLRVLRGAAADEAGEAGLDAVHVDVAAERAVQDGLDAAAAERRASRGGVGDGAGEREHVRRGERLLLADDLRRDVAGGAVPRARLGDLRLPLAARDAEVDQARAVRGEDHVARLEVAVLDALPVDLQQALRERGEQPQAGAGGDRAVLGDGLPERRAGDVLGGQPVRRRVQPGADHRGGRPGPHPLDGRDLAAEPRERLRALEVLPDHLDRDVPAAAGQAQVDLPHPAGAEPPQQRVAADLRGILRTQRFHGSPAPRRRLRE